MLLLRTSYIVLLRKESMGADIIHGSRNTRLCIPLANSFSPKHGHIDLLDEPVRKVLNVRCCRHFDQTYVARDAGLRWGKSPLYLPCKTNVKNILVYFLYSQKRII